MNFGRTQTFGSLHSPCDLGKYNYIKRVFKKMLPSLVGLNEVLWFLLSLHCRLADNSQLGLRSLVGEATITILLEHCHLTGAATAPRRSRTKDNLPDPTLCPASEGLLLLGWVPLATPAGRASPHSNLPCFGLRKFKATGMWAISTSGPSTCPEETLD